MIHSAHKGFSLFEFTVVLVIIAVLMRLYFSAVDSPVRKSQERAIDFQANTFSRAVANIRGLAIAKQVKVVNSDGVSIYVNEFGWPVNTSAAFSPLSTNQTPEECLQLWYGIFRSPVKAALFSKKATNVESRADYMVSSIDGHICRYQLSRKQDGHYFFDYDVEIGTVVVSTQ